MPALDRSANARRAILDTMRVSNLFDRRWGAVTQGAGITSAQWLTLGLLERDGGPDGLTPTELCRRLCVSKQNMTGMILRLEKKGLIERRPDPHDRRSFRVLTTQKGSRAVQTLAPFESEFFLRQVEGHLGVHYRFGRGCSCHRFAETNQYLGLLHIPCVGNAGSGIWHLSISFCLEKAD